MAASDALLAALYGAPDLTSNPSLALAAASDPQDPSGTGQALSQSTFAAKVADNAPAMAGAVPEGHHNVFSKFLHATGISTAMTYLNKPLQEMQHDYRYLRDVYATHGWMAGLTETSAVIGAGVAGTILSGGNPIVGALAAEATITTLAHSVYKDSYARAGNPDYMLNGHLVSPGRDLADVFGLDVTSNNGQGSGLGKVVSGATDMGFDIAADPLMKLGALNRAVRSGDLAEQATKAAARGRMVSVNTAVARFAPGQRVVDATQMNALRDAPVFGAGYRRALEDIASKKPAEIMKAYPDQVGLADRLGAATSSDQVHGVFLDALNESELVRRALHNTLPSRSLMRSPVQRARSAVSDKIGVNLEDENSIRKALVKPTPSNIQGAISRKIRTFTNEIPIGIDPVMMKMSGSHFDPTGPTAAKTVFQIFNYAMSPRLARDWTDRFIAATTDAERKAIYAEGLVENAKAAGFATDSQYMEHLTNSSRQFVHGPAASTNYGPGRLGGEETSNMRWTAMDGQTVTDQAALFGWQTSHLWAIPDYKMMRNAISDMRNPVISKMAQTDEWIRSHYTDPVFKPFALINSGFGMRVGASEASGEILRNGGMAYFRAQVAQVSGRIKYKLTAHERDITSIEEGAKIGDEPSHIIAAAAKVMGGINVMLRSDPQDVEVAMEMVIKTNGHLTTGIANSGHNSLISPDNPAQRASDASWWIPGHDKRLGSKETGSYRMMDRNDPNYTGHWVKQLNNGAHEPSVQRIAQDMITAKTGGLDEQQMLRYLSDREAQRIAGIDPSSGKQFLTDPYAAERESIGRYARQDPQEFASHRADTVMNYVIGADGTVHDMLVRQLAAGKMVHREDMLDSIPEASRPSFISGADEVPNIGPGLMSRVADKGFGVFVKPFVQNLGRNPLFFAAVKTQLKSLKGAVDGGVLTQEEAMRVAMLRGSLDMLPKIHNTYLRSQASQMMNNFLPFYFAQEQAMRRIGLVISKNPAAVRGYMLEAQAINDPGFVHTSKDGTKTTVIPLGGVFGQSVLHGLGALGIPVSYGLPMAFNGNMSSLDTVIPTLEAPGISPLGAIALNTLEQYAPSTSSLVKAVEGPAGYNKSLRDELIPSAFLRNIVKALSPSESDRGWTNAYMTALAAADAHGQLPPADASPQQKQAFMDRIKHNAQSAFLAKAVIGMFSPVAPQPILEDMKNGQTWREEFQRLVDPTSSTFAGSYSAALVKFQKDHGDDSTSYTIAKSQSSTGATAPATKEALDFLIQHEGLLTGSQGVGASFLMPQSGAPGDGQLVYNELLKDRLRERRTPEQFRDALYSNEGDRQFFAGLDKHKANVLALNPNDAKALGAENSAWSAWVLQQQIANPIWAASFNPQQRKLRAQQAVQDLSQILSDGTAPTGEQTDLVAGLMDDYQRHMGNVAAARVGVGTIKGETDAWKAYLDQRALDDPRVGNVVRTIFKAL